MYFPDRYFANICQLIKELYILNAKDWVRSKFFLELYKIYFSFKVG